MCGRFSLIISTEELLDVLQAAELKDSVPRYNIAPTQEILILRAGSEGRKELAAVRWGLIPAWARELPSGAPLINARCETVRTKPSFRESLGGLSRSSTAP